MRFKALIFQKRHGETEFYYRTLISRIGCNFWQSLKKIVYIGFRATFNLRGLYTSCTEFWKRQFRKQNHLWNFHFTFKIHVVEGKTQVLLFLPRLRELSMFCFLILKFRLFRVTNSSHKVAKAFYLYHLSLLSHFDKLDSFQRTPDWSKIL